MQKFKKKKYTEFRIPKLPKELREAIVDHQLYRMKGRPEIWEAAIEILRAGVPIVEAADKTNVSAG